MLPEDVLLNIFRLYLNSSPRSWSTLTHVTQKWRHIVFASPLGLDLRLYCTYGTPVSKTLDCWPSLPIVVHYGETVLDPLAPEDEDNIVAALKHSDRVSFIDLTITSSLLKKVSAIEMPFLELEELVLRSLASVQLALPRTLQWGTRLRRLHSTRIAFPALPVLLSASTGLVDLQLHEIPKVGYFSPEALANALSEMTQLEKLSLHFLSFPSRRNHLGLPPQSGERVVLPALTCLKYRGTSKYLDSFVARIDAPCLGDVDITFFGQPTMDASQLGRFMERIEILTTLSKAEVKFSELATSITFAQPDGPTQLELGVSCERLDWQLSSIAQICAQISPFTFRVENLRIREIQQPSGQGGIDPEQWPKLIRPFRGVKRFFVDDKPLSEFLFDSGLANRKHLTVFPYLLILGVLEFEPMPHRSFATSRLLKRRHVYLFAQECSCMICHASFTGQQEIKRHLVVLHSFHLVCPYCGNFEFTPKYNHIFQEHISSKHPEVSHTDALIFDSSLLPFSPSVNVGAFTMFMAPKHLFWPGDLTEVETRPDTVFHFLPSPHPT
jgi:hypothetical protein